MASVLVCSALPNTTCPTSAPSTPEASSAPLAAKTPRSVAEKSFSAPPKVPIPVRLAERKTTSVSLPCVAISMSRVQRGSGRKRRRDNIVGGPGRGKRGEGVRECESARVRECGTQREDTTERKGGVLPPYGPSP